MLLGGHTCSCTSSIATAVKTMDRQCYSNRNTVPFILDAINGECNNLYQSHHQADLHLGRLQSHSWWILSGQWVRSSSSASPQSLDLHRSPRWSQKTEAKLVHHIIQEYIRLFLFSSECPGTRLVVTCALANFTNTYMYMYMYVPQ